MTVSFNVTGKERKALVQALSEIVFSEAVYAGAPSFDYQVGDYTIDKNGVLSYPDTLSKEAVALVVEKLSERGFAPADEDEAETPEKDAPAQTPAEMPDVAAEAAPADQPEAEAMEAADGAETPDVAETPERLPLTPTKQLPRKNPRTLPIPVLVTSSLSAFRAAPSRMMRWNA